MPFIKESERAKIDGEIERILKKVKGDAPALSYVILRLLMDGFDNSIDGYIKAMGCVEETKLTFYNMVFLPTEQLILAKRWASGDGEWKHE